MENFTNITNITSASKSAVELTTEEQMVVLNARLFVYGYLLFPLCVLGVILNGFTILVLLHPRMRSFSTNAYLTTLSLANIVCLINFIFLYSLRYILSYQMFRNIVILGTAAAQDANVINQYESYISLIYGIWSPIFTTFQLFTFYLTCAVTVDRWVYVTWPLKADKICTLRNTFTAIALIFLFCFVYNLPRWFEIESVRKSTPLNQTYYQARMTSFAKTPLFTLVMRRYGYFIFVYGLPFSVLLVVNIGIAQKLIEAKRRKKRLLGNNTKKYSTASAKSNTNNAIITNAHVDANPGDTGDEAAAAAESDQPPVRQSLIARRISRALVTGLPKKPSIKLDTRITFMVIAVVVAFFLCQFPYLIVNLLASTQYSGRKWFHLCKVACDFLAALNCCVNFIIYCLFGQKFREIAKDMLLNPSLRPYNRASQASQKMQQQLTVRSKSMAGPNARSYSVAVPKSNIKNPAAASNTNDSNNSNENADV
jgi:hypothetical protein